MRRGSAEPGAGAATKLMDMKLMNMKEWAPGMTPFSCYHAFCSAWKRHGNSGANEGGQANSECRAQSLDGVLHGATCAGSRKGARSPSVNN
jgi:hypothetical protein